MRVTFVQPYFKNIWESVGIGYIISYCKNRFPNVQFNVVHENYDPLSDILRECLGSDIVAFSATTPTYRRTLELARTIKQSNKNICTVLGGWHSTTAGADGVDFNYIDKIVVGEGETAFLEILSGSVSKIFIGGRLSFEELPWPDRVAIQENRQIDYCQATFGERIVSLQSIRGCKMNCTMCGQTFMTGHFDKVLNPLRIRHPRDTMDEIEYLDTVYNIQRFKFLDPTWSVSEDVVFGFCEEKLKRNNKIKWDVLVHAAFVTEKSLEIMSRANCDIIMVGCESGSQRILNEMRKGITTSQIEDVFEWARKYGIKRRSFFMLGMPFEGPVEIAQTYKLIQELDPDIFSMTFLTPYPGTDYYDAKKFKDIDWSPCDIYDNDFWENNYFTNRELKGIHRWFNRTFQDILVHHKKNGGIR